jgi:hypothetical protein
MGDGKMTLGQAIDKLVEALDPLDADARRTAIQAACQHLGIPFDGVAPSHVPSTPPPAAPPSQTTATKATSAADIRSLKEEKQPSTATQMACIVAYYLQELAPAGERKDTVTTPDIEKYFKQAGYRLPAKINQVLVDAKGSGYFESVQRGEYRLNTVGYNLVAHNLPRPKAS